MIEKNGKLEVIPGHPLVVYRQRPGDTTLGYQQSARDLGHAEEIISFEQSRYPGRRYFIVEMNVLAHREPAAKQRPAFESPIDALSRAVSLLQSCTDDEFDEEGWTEVAGVAQYLENYRKP